MGTHELNFRYQVCLFFRPIWKTNRLPPGFWLAETFCTSSLKSLNEMFRILTGSKKSTSSIKFFFRLIRKTRWPPSLWLAETFTTSSLKPLNGICQNLTGSKNSTSPYQVCVFGLIRKTRWPPSLLLAEPFTTSSLNGNSLDIEEKIIILFQICVFRTNQNKTKWPPRPLIGGHIFGYSSGTA